MGKENGGWNSSDCRCYGFSCPCGIQPWVALSSGENWDDPDDECAGGEGFIPLEDLTEAACDMFGRPLYLYDENDLRQEEEDIGEIIEFALWTERLLPEQNTVVAQKIATDNTSLESATPSQYHWKDTRLSSLPIRESNGVVSTRPSSKKNQKLWKRWTRSCGWRGKNDLYKDRSHLRHMAQMAQAT